ncbi:MAG: acyl--CoA ligase [Propionibacterium sp.]|nr:acyl--CoA ligase [Propionibacterium sp.]
MTVRPESGRPRPAGPASGTAGMLIGSVIDAAVRSRPTHVAGTLGEESITFAELDARAEALADNLVALGLPAAGDEEVPLGMVAWVCQAHLDSLAALLACGRLGVVFAPVNPNYTPTELAAVLDVLRPDLVVHDAAIPVGPDWPAVTREDIAARHAPARGDDLPEPLPTDPHIAYLTSGSTGTPKAVLVSHLASWLRSSPGGGTFSTGVRGAGGIMCTFPLYHYGGWHYTIEAWLSHTAIHLVAKADARLILESITKHRATALYSIPAVWERILAHPGDWDLSCLQHADTGTSPVGGGLIESIRERCPNASTSVLYGSTEAGRMAGLQHWELGDHPGSVGRAAFPGVVWCDPDTGEVCFRGPTVMNGYLRNPEATAAAMRDGAYLSGDRGVMDEDGYLTLVGRTKELVRTGGEFVAPAEVEAVLREHPRVALAGIVGLPDPTWHEIVCAVIVPNDPADPPTLAELREHLTGKLASFKHPRRLEIVDKLPLTPATGQIQRSKLRARFSEAVAPPA